MHKFIEPHRRIVLWLDILLTSNLAFDDLNWLRKKIVVSHATNTIGIASLAMTWFYSLTISYCDTLNILNILVLCLMFVVNLSSTSRFALELTGWDGFQLQLETPWWSWDAHVSLPIGRLAHHHGTPQVDERSFRGFSYPRGMQNLLGDGISGGQILDSFNLERACSQRENDWRLKQRQDSWPQSQILVHF